MKVLGLVLAFMLLASVAFADTITNYTSGAGDGFVYWSSYDVTTWAQLHDAVDGTSYDYVSGGGAGYYNARTTWYSGLFSRIDRGFFPIDTSGIADDDTITSAVLYIHIFDKGATDNDEYSYIGIVQTSQAATNALATTDYDQSGTYDAGHITIDNIVDTLHNGTGNGWNAFSLDATGIGWINKTGWTLLGTREGHDLTNNAILTTKTNYVECYFSENATYKPYLQVTTTTAGGGTGFSVDPTNRAIFTN